MDCNDFDPQLCIVQLTDFHFGEELQSNYQKRVDDILETIKNSIKSGTVLLLVTGDVARTGKVSEYQSAAMFFDYLIEQLNQPEYQLKVYILPGNHDLQGPCRSIECFSGVQYDLDLENMASFFEFANKYDNRFVFGQPGPIVFEVEGTKVSVSGFNSAPLSTLDGDDKGFHVLRNPERALLDNTPDSGLHIFASHHGPEWFCDNERLSLEKMLASCFDFAFTGHEHMGQSRCVGGLSGESCVVVRGGTYSLNDDDQSTYKMLLIRFGELGSYEFAEKVFSWGSSAQVHARIDEDRSCRRYIKSITCPYSLLGGAFYRVFRKCGENRNLPRTLRFLPTKPQVAGVQNRGLVGRPLFFTALPNSPVDNMRQPLESPSTTAFPHKGSAGRSIVAFRSARHARDLSHTSEF